MVGIDSLRSRSPAFTNAIGNVEMREFLRDSRSVRQTRRTLLCGIVSIAFVFAQAPTPPAPKTLNLWPGAAPGSEQWRQPETVVGSAGNRRIMNVSTPTLTVYLPDPSSATGTAVIIAPGGGFVWLSIDS